MNPADLVTGSRRGAVSEVFLAFLILGLTSFGGPIAHLGYFRAEFVTRRRWLADERYADLVSLCQFLPGPASSQVGFSIGLQRAGLPGALAAWLGFTAPSAILLAAFAGIAAQMSGPAGGALMHGLELVALAIIAQAVQGMASSLCPDRARASIAIAALLATLAIPGSATQLLVIASGGLVGLAWCHAPASTTDAHAGFRLSHLAGYLALAAYALLLLLLPLLARALGGPALTAVDGFYRAGALVFGGGHVVLPLLREAFVASGQVSDDVFLAGYGAAQAVPGPLFTFAAYLGARILPAGRGVAGAVLGIVSIFLPGMLVLLGVLPFWESLRRRAGIRSAMMGVNAAVVGLLAATLYTPVWTSSVHGATDFLLALAAFFLLTIWRIRPLAVVIVTGALAVLLALARQAA